MDDNGPGGFVSGFQQMIRAYKVVDRTPTHVTFEYNALCSWWLYSTITAMFIGIGFEFEWLELVGAGSIIIYLAIVYFPALKVARRLRRAMRSGGVQVSGSRWSFSNPLRFKTLRTADETVSDA